MVVVDPLGTGTTSKSTCHSHASIDHDRSQCLTTLPLSHTGDGVIDALDTDLNGKIDANAFDTTGDGKVDAIDDDMDGTIDRRIPQGGGAKVHVAAAD